MSKNKKIVPLHNSSVLQDILKRESEMEWDVPELRAAQVRLANVVGRLGLSEDILEKLSFPKRATVCSVPVRLDDGHLKVFPGYLVNHSDTLGPSQGQLRFHPQVSLGEISALAMSHTWRSALVGLPLGGAQGGVRCDPLELSSNELQRITRRFTTEMVPLIGPDRNVLSPGLGTDEQTMAWMMDTYSQMQGVAVRQVVTGKPRVIGGSKGRREASGRGAVYIIMEAAKRIGLTLDSNTRVAVQGFGKFGRAAAKFLSRSGCKIIAVDDIRGGVVAEEGLHFDRLLEYADKTGSVAGFANTKPITNEELFRLPCDILILAATSNQITDRNASEVRAKIVCEGASEGISPKGDEILNQRKICVLPDLLASAGVVIVSYLEWVQGLQSFLWTSAEINQRLRQMMVDTFQRVYDLSQREKVDYRTAALMAGVSKVAEAIETRGIYP